MRLSRRLLALLALLALVGVVADAQNVLYDDGPINGQTNGFAINIGFAVSDSFTISGGPSTLTGMGFGVWLLVNDRIASVDVSITSQEFGGTSYFAGTVNLTTSGCFSNNFGLYVCQETGDFDGPTLNNGTYWMTLQNAVTTEGDIAAWDENDGVGCQSGGCPSQASQSSVGTIPAESFTVFGRQGGTETTPEPGSLLLLGSGAAMAIGLVRRKML